MAFGTPTPDATRRRWILGFFLTMIVGGVAAGIVWLLATSAPSSCDEGTGECGPESLTTVVET